MDRYPPQQGRAFRHPATAGGHGAERQWQPGEAGAGQEPGSFLSNARARRDPFALPWQDPHERGPAHPNWTATCDWGDCDQLSVTMRWDDRLKQWLAVCADHVPDQDARCTSLPPSHKSWECV